MKRKDNLKVNKEKENVGGIALANGIILKSEKRDSITKISKDGKIKVKVEKHFIGKKEKFNILESPFIRGIYNIVSQLASSKDDLKDNVKMICDALNIKYEEEELDISVPLLVTIIILVVALFIAIIPSLISIPFDKYQNIVQSSLQSLIFFALLFTIVTNKALKSVLEYHGAEHKIVNAYENLQLEEINIENVKKESRIHRRCGSNFIDFFILITILETLFINVDNVFIKMLIIAFVTLPNISLSYELVILLSKFPKWLSYAFYPIMAIQYFTTKSPSDDKIKLAIYGLNAVAKDKLEISVAKFLEKYKNENKEIIEKSDYTLMHMLQIVSYVTNKSTNSIYISINEYMLKFNEQIEIERLLDKLFKEDIPLQYITNRAYFYNEEYIVNNNVLIPREDTEILVEKAIEYINNYNLKDMIDLCTGSGCIGISIANNSSIEKVILSDISKEALNVARKHISLNNVVDKVSTYHSDLLDLYINDNILVDIIVSNPPYIKTADIKKLDKKVQKEPILALDGGISGLDIYIKILEQARYVLNNNGYLMFEIGYDELEDLRNIITNYTEYEFIESIKDYGGNDRVIICKYKEE